VFELVRRLWVAIRWPPDFISGLPLIGTFDVFGINSRHSALSINVLPPLDHITHTLV
jgi:hypothetical protein